MVLVIISDIHGNLEALEAALSLIDEAKPDQIICLGDIVGYGANPNECVDLVRSKSQVVLLGNHDAAAIGLTSVEYFNTHARRAAHWTAEVLTGENTAYLRALPMDYRGEGFYAVHASPHEPSVWHYVINQGVADEAFHAFNDPVCFLGHSHVPVLFREGGERGEHLDEGDHVLEGNGRFIVNVGSVGQPRDNDPRLSFGLYETEGRKLSIRRHE